MITIDVNFVLDYFQTNRIELDDDYTPKVYLDLEEYIYYALKVYNLC